MAWKYKKINIRYKISLPDGELAASLRYLSQRFGMPDQVSKAILNDIGTEELAHLEMVGTMVHQLTDGLSVEEIKKAGLGDYYTDHGVGLEYILKEFNNNLN